MLLLLAQMAKGMQMMMSMVPNRGKASTSSPSTKSFSMLNGSPTSLVPLSRMNPRKFAIHISGGSQLESSIHSHDDGSFLNNIPKELNASYTKFPNLLRIPIALGYFAILAIRNNLVSGRKASNVAFKTFLNMGILVSAIH